MPNAPRTGPPVTLWLLAIGFISLLSQVVLLRELAVAFFGSELIYILALAAWLLWTALGAALGRPRALPGPGEVRALLLAFAMSLPGLVVATRGSRLLLGAVPGAYLPFQHQILFISLVLLPMGVMLGLLFQWTAKLHIGGRRGLASAYAMESGGAVLGGLTATLLLAMGIQNLSAVLFCSLLAFAAALPAAGGGKRRLDRTGVVALLGALATIAALLASAPLDRLLTSWNHPHLAATADSPYGRITVTTREGQVAVYHNNSLAFENQGTASEELAHLSALQHPNPNRILLLGGGIEGIVEELLHHRPQHIDYVELDATLLTLLRPYVTSELQPSEQGGTFHVTISDPRAFLRGPERWDVIVVAMPEPDSGQGNRFFTREFFEECSSSLEDNGILAFRLRGAENLWSPAQTQRAASLYRALEQVFADVLVLPGSTNVFLASRTSLTRDPLVLSRRLEARGIKARVIIPPYLEYLYTNDRFHAIRRRLGQSTAPANEDLRPAAYRYTQWIWLSRFYPRLTLTELQLPAPGSLLRNPWAVIPTLFLVVFSLAVRRGQFLRREFIAAMAGFSGMILEVVLILHYQTRNGVLYQDLGLLLTLFMAGLALGAGTLTRPAASRLAQGRGFGIVLAVLLFVLSLIQVLGLRSGVSGGLLSTGVLLLGAGFLVSAIFAWASLQGAPEQRPITGPLYAADLLGGSAGALLASIVLVPLVGLDGATMVAALAAALILPAL